MYNEKDTFSTITEINDIKAKILLLRKQLFSDDITQTNNRLWIFKHKLNNDETFNNFGFLVSIKISDYENIVGEYDTNVGNKLLKQVSNYIIYYMNNHHLKYDIVRYMEDNFLIFMDNMNEKEIQEHIRDMQNGMSNYKFKHRSKRFQLVCYAAVMQYLKNESFTSVLDQLDEKLFQNKA